MAPLRLPFLRLRNAGVGCLRRTPRGPTNSWALEFRCLLAAPDAVIVLDNRGWICLLNGAAEELLATSTDQASGNTLNEVVRFRELADGSSQVERVGQT
jgi:nitrogen-specific signal transduction histidine kinase